MVNFQFFVLTVLNRGLMVVANITSRKLYFKAGVGIQLVLWIAWIAWH